jgi:hypothetical protein
VTAYAEEYLDAFRDDARTRQAFADASRFEELAEAALDRLNAAARSFGRTADENWDSRLALPDFELRSARRQRRAVPPGERDPQRGPVRERRGGLKYTNL